MICQNHADNIDAGIAVGLAFGEAIAAETDYEWVRVMNEYGEETALSPVGFMAARHPISILQKRIAKREDVCLADRLQAVIEAIETRRAAGAFDRR